MDVGALQNLARRLPARAPQFLPATANEGILA